MILISVFCLMFFFTSCQKELSIKETTNSVKVNGSKNFITPYLFNWEDPNLNFMPYPSNQPQIPVPWSGAGGLASIVSSDVLDDRKASDGWELVYSTFDPIQWNPNPYFMLYNKYRGLLRIYFYLNSVQNLVESTYLQSGLTTGENTTLLNFAETEVVDASIHKVRVDKIEPKPFAGYPTSNYRWYFFQYEMAYDPNLRIMPPLSINGPQLTFYLSTINVQQISLGGTIEANIKGSIGASSASAGQNLFNTVTGQLKDMGKGAITAIGKNLINNETTDSITGVNKLGVDPALWKVIKGGLSAAMSSVTSNIPGTITNVLSAILKGSTSNAGQTVSLTLDGTINLNGSLTGAGAFPSTPIDWFIPGTLTPPYGVQQFVPLYPYKLGVFNLGSKPTVNINIKRYPKNYYTGKYIYQTSYSIPSSTINLQWNPEVTAIANINNIATDILVLHYYQVANGLLSMSGRYESVKGNKTFSASAANTLTTMHESVEPPSSFMEIFFRVAFVVEPKNGAPSSVIIKTFELNKNITYEGF